MNRSILVVSVMVTAMLVASSAMAYAKQSEKTTPATTGSVTIQNHSWGGYHWARQSNPFTLNLGDNVTTVWDSYLGNTSSDWSIKGSNAAAPNPVNTRVVPGQSNNKRCGATLGRIEVCNSAYGNNGWLGIATIWLSSDASDPDHSHHITQGTTKLNDTYFKKAQYNTPAWRNLVMCQEVGHNFGLDHQDENFNNNNLNTCMDYTNNPASNQHPNQHDYDELAIIYAHLDKTTTVGASTASSRPTADPNDPRNEPGDSPSAWGKEIFRSSDGRTSVYEKDLGKGQKKVTHVLWTEQKAAKHRGH
jgi:hypothetical protein